MLCDVKLKLSDMEVGHENPPHQEVANYILNVLRRLSKRYEDVVSNKTGSRSSCMCSVQRRELLFDELLLPHKRHDIAAHADDEALFVVVLRIDLIDFDPLPLQNHTKLVNRALFHLVTSFHEIVSRSFFRAVQQ